VRLCQQLVEQRGMGGEQTLESGATALADFAQQPPAHGHDPEVFFLHTFLRRAQSQSAHAQHAWSTPIN
jgi:hypothetical protein